MSPRKKESKKWSEIPKDLGKQIKDLFLENFKAQLTGKKILITGRIYASEIIMRIGINSNGELKYTNFEASVDHSAEKQDSIKKIQLAVDALASLLMDYFENDEEHDLPYDWQEYPFEKQKIWLKHSTENPDLETEANKLLGLTEDLDTLEETENDLELFGLKDDEEIDTSRPKIFRVPTENTNDSLKKKKKKQDMH